MSDVTPEDLDRWEAEAKAATPGPWTLDEEGCCVYGPKPGDVLAERIDNVPTAELMASSRTAVPALIAEVRRLRALLDERGGQEP